MQARKSDFYASLTLAVVLVLAVLTHVFAENSYRNSSGVTGTGNIVYNTSPTLVTPALGTPSSGTLTSCTGLPVAGGGTGVATITSGNVVVGQGTGAVVSTGIFIAGTPLTGAKFVNLTIQGTAGTGSTDLIDAATGATYVVPANKIAIIGAGRIYNGNAATSIGSFQIKVSGAYYRITADVSNLTGVGAASNATPIILNTGEGVALTSDKATQNAWVSCIECSSSAYIKTYRILALANGNNTLYTVPASKTAYVLPTNMACGGGNVGLVSVTNSTGGALNHYVNIVTSGGAVATTNQLAAATATNDKSIQSLSVPVAMAAGDFINVNASAGTAGQVAWVTVIEY